MIRRVVLGLALVGLAFYAWIAIQVYRAQADPEHFQAWDGPNAWIVGPTAKSLNKVAGEKIEGALALLNDTARPPAERLAAYREQLKAAERLLVRSLRAQPAQARTLARLAAVRWELVPPLDDDGIGRFLDTIETASRMAPGSAYVQKDLGELLTRMGRTDEAFAYLARGVELNPAVTKDAVTVLRGVLVPPGEIRSRLPRIPEVLVELVPDYFEAGEADAFLAACEEMLGAPTPRLLQAYAGGAIQAKQAARALERLDGIPASSPSSSSPPSSSSSWSWTELEAERLMQRSRLLVAVGEKVRAVEVARAARELQPQVARFSENLGYAALAAGDPDGAVRAFREALALVAQAPGEATAWRAMIYREIGRAEEARKATDRAYDAYRKAVELNPDEPYARRRLAEMHKAAGLEPAPAPPRSSPSRTP